MLRKIDRVLTSRGILYLVTRFCGSALRRRAFDQNYISGRWDHFDKEPSTEIVKVIEKYARKGRILDLGCGTGILASMLSPDSFEYYLGVDASQGAIARAQKRKGEKIRVEIGDILSYKPRGKFDLIVFAESLYYVPYFRRRFLRCCARWLMPGGLFVVTIVEPRRFRSMIKMIRENFQIVEDRFFQNSQRLLLVFG